MQLLLRNPPAEPTQLRSGTLSTASSSCSSPSESPRAAPVSASRSPEPTKRFGRAGGCIRRLDRDRGRQSHSGRNAAPGRGTPAGAPSFRHPRRRGRLHLDRYGNRLRAGGRLPAGRRTPGRARREAPVRRAGRRPPRADDRQCPSFPPAATPAARDRHAHARDPGSTRPARAAVLRATRAQARNGRLGRLGPAIPAGHVRIRRRNARRPLRPADAGRPRSRTRSSGIWLRTGSPARRPMPASAPPSPASPCRARGRARRPACRPADSSRRGPRRTLRPRS